MCFRLSSTSIVGTADRARDFARAVHKDHATVAANVLEPRPWRPVGGFKRAMHMREVANCLILSHTLYFRALGTTSDTVRGGKRGNFGGRLPVGYVIMGHELPMHRWWRCSAEASIDFAHAFAQNQSERGAASQCGQGTVNSILRGAKTCPFMSKGDTTMFKLTTLTAATLILVAGAAAAQEADPSIDVNGDGFYSFPEVGTIYPDLTDADFTAMDSTGDGLLDMAEVAAAQDAGMMPPAE